MTERCSVRQMRAQYTTYPIDTDQISTVPECTRIPPNEERPSDHAKAEPIYESPLTEVTNSVSRGDRRKGSGSKGPRAKTNNIYERSCDQKEINGVYSGYSYVSKNNDAVSLASTVGELPTCTTPPQEGCLFAWTNPIAIPNDESADYAEIPIRAPIESDCERQSRPRSRMNEVYSWDTYSAVDIFRDMRGKDGKGRPRKRKRRWHWYAWFSMLLAITALVMACWAYIQSHRALTESNLSEGRVSGMTAMKKNYSDEGNIDEVKTTEPPKVNLTNQYNELKKKIDSLSKSYSKLLEQYNAMKQQDSTMSQTLEDIKVQLTESNSRYSKSNVSLWEKLKGLKGPRGYNGTKGDTGPQGPRGPEGPPGPRGLSIKNCTYEIYNKTTQLGITARFYAIRKETKKEKIFHVSCHSNIDTKKSEKYDPKDSSLKSYTCTCTTPLSHAGLSKTLECIMKYVLCKLP